jgi:fatty acid desaturase
LRLTRVVCERNLAKPSKERPRMTRFTPFVAVAVLTLLSLLGLAFTLWALVPLVIFGALTASLAA